MRRKDLMAAAASAMARADAREAESGKTEAEEFHEVFHPKPEPDPKPNGNGGERPKRKARKSKQVIAVAQPADDGSGEWEPVQLSYEEIEELLSHMDEVEYDRCRQYKAQEWAPIRLDTLDKLFKSSRRLRTYRQKPQQPPPDPADLEARLKPILETEGILDLWVKDWDKVMAGEHLNAKLLYLVATSRLFHNTMHAAVKGPSSGGKSQIRKQVLEFFPPEDIVTFTTMSEKALLYHEGDFIHKILSMAEAVGSEQWEFQDLLLRELMSEGKLVYPVPQKIAGHIVTQNIVKHGPVSFIVTTTKAALHPENETRMLSLEIDDSEGQTKRVLRKQAKTIGRNLKPDPSIYYDWQDFQRLLRIVGNKNVTVPFAGALAALIPPRAVRLRRDYPQIIAAIKAHAFIHLYRRTTNEKGELVADLELDYVPVVDLIGHIASEGAGIAVSDDLLATIDAVKVATSDPNMPPDDGATAHQIGKLLGLDNSTAGRRLGVAAAKGLVSISSSANSDPANIASPTRRWRPKRYCQRRTKSGHTRRNEIFHIFFFL